MRNALIVVVFTALIVFIGWWISDEPLDPVATAWLEQPTPESQAYNLLLGMGSETPITAEEVGRRLFEEQQRDNGTFAPARHFHHLDDEALLCDYTRHACLLSQRENAKQAKALLRDNQVLVDRYQQFLALDDFSDNTPLSFSAEFPRYALLLHAARLQSLSLSIRPDPGITLEKEIDRLRRLLTRNHSLISKLMVARILGEKINLSALLIQEKHAIALDNYQLSIEEKSFADPLRNEFRLRATFLLEEQYADDDTTNFLELTLLEAGLRKHTTLNRDLQYTRHLMDLSENPPAIIAEDIYRMPEPTLSQTLRNPVGNYLLGMATPDMKQYLLRMAHLDAKLQLLVWFRHPTPGLANPWPESDGPRVSEDKAQLCFPTQFNTAEYNSCLPLLNDAGNP